MTVGEKPQPSAFIDLVHKHRTAVARAVGCLGREHANGHALRQLTQLSNASRNIGTHEEMHSKSRAAAGIWPSACNSLKTGCMDEESQNVRALLYRLCWRRDSRRLSWIAASLRERARSAD